MFRSASRLILVFQNPTTRTASRGQGCAHPEAFASDKPHFPNPDLAVAIHSFMVALPCVRECRRSPCRKSRSPSDVAGTPQSLLPPGASQASTDSHVGYYRTDLGARGIVIPLTWCSPPQAIAAQSCCCRATRAHPKRSGPSTADLRMVARGNLTAMSPTTNCPVSRNTLPELHTRRSRPSD